MLFSAGPVAHNPRYVDAWDYKQSSSQHHEETPLVRKSSNHTLPPAWNTTGRLLWDRDQDKNALPQFVDKALKLLNLKQVAFEIENSVMSKVSCTACKAGKF